MSLDCKQLDWEETFGSNGDTNNWHYVSYIAADNTDTQHDYYEVPAGGSNRWHIQSYFPDQPTYDSDQGSSNFIYYCEPVECIQQINCNYAQGSGNENPNFDFVAETPNDEYNASFEVYLEASFGPVTAGVSASFNDLYTNFTDTPHQNAKWVIDCDSYPTEQDDNRGCYVDAKSTGGVLGQEQFSAQSSFAWNYMQYDNNTGDSYIMYSETDSNDHLFTCQVVDT